MSRTRARRRAVSAYRDNGGGDCFPTTVAFLTSGLMEEAAAATRTPLVKNERSPWRVVHGLPVGTGGDVEGVRHWHAWVEVRTPEGHLVLDLSNGKELRVPRALFYAVGRLDEDLVWRFTPAEAAAEANRHGHCGPWVDGWESML